MRKYLRPIEPEERTLDFSAELMDVKQAAAFLKVSTMTVRRLYTQREISFIKIGGTIRFAKKDILDYLNRHRLAAIHKLQ